MARAATGSDAWTAKLRGTKALQRKSGEIQLILLEITNDLNVGSAMSSYRVEGRQARRILDARILCVKRFWSAGRFLCWLLQGQESEKKKKREHPEPRYLQVTGAGRSHLMIVGE